MAQARNRFSVLFLALLLVFIFVLQSILPGFTEMYLLDISALEGEWWRFITAFFLHANLSHLISNLFALLLFGIILESIVGTRNFLVIYLSSGILANIYSLIFYPASLGASGAIYGLIGAVTVLRPLMIIWAFGLLIPMFVAAIMYIIIDFLGLFTPDGVGHIAHLSGMMVGFLMGYVLRRRYPRKRRSRKLKSSSVRLHEPSMRVWEERNMR